MVEEREREKKKKNIIISGDKVEELGEKSKLTNWLKEKLGVEVKIWNTWKTKGRKVKVGARCETDEDKEKIMRNKNKLGDTKVYIDNDTTFAERRNKETVWKKAEELRNKGKTAKIGYNRVTSGEEVWKWNERLKKWFRDEKKETGRN